MQFCSNCGAKLPPNKTFCTECGSKGENNATPSSVGETATKTISKKKFISIGLALLMGILLFSAHFILKGMHNPAKAAEEFIQAVKTEDYAQLADIMNDGQDKVKVDKEIAKAFLAYMGENVDSEDPLKALQKDAFYLENEQKTKAIKDMNGNKLFILEEKPKKFLFFYKQYGITFYPFELFVSSPYEKTDIYLNDKKTVQIKEAKTSQSAGYIFPGEYTLKADLNTEYSNLSNEDTLYFEDAEKNVLSVEAELEGDSVIVYSDDDDAVLFANGKSTGMKVADIDYFGPLEKDGSVKLHAEREINGKHEKTESVEVTEDVIHLLFDGELVADKIEEVTEDSVDATGTDFTNDEEVEVALQRYFEGYFDSVENAISYEDFSIVSPYIESSSDLYESTRVHIDNVAEKGTKQEMLDFEIIDYRDGPEGYIVTIQETYNFWNKEGVRTHKVVQADHYITSDYDSFTTYAITNNKTISEEKFE